MSLSPRRWRAHHLLGAWIVYWVALIAVTLGPGVLAVLRIRGAPENTSSVNFNLGDQGLNGDIKSYGATLWSAHASLGAVVLWLVVPPLLLWLVWAVARPRPVREAHDAHDARGAGGAPRGLGAGDPRWQEPAPAERDAARPPRER
jgi:hypothetical protein